MRSRFHPLSLVALPSLTLLLIPLLLATALFFVPAALFAAEPEGSTLDPQRIEALDLFEAINEVRDDYGLAPFDWDVSLARAARSHVAYMDSSGHYSHYQANGSSPRMRIEATGYIPERTGEAIGWGYNQQRMLAWWLDSAPHRRLLLSDDHEQIGIGYLGDPDARWGHTWTLNFASHK